MSHLPSPGNWETILRAPDVVETLAEVILVHDLSRNGGAQENLEQTICEICSAVGNSVGVTCNVSVYRFNSKSIQDSGGFEIECDEFINNLHLRLVERAGGVVPTASPHTYPNVVVIAFELGAWLVRNMLNVEASLLGEEHEEFASILPRLSGVIFLGADDEQEHFRYATYVQRRLQELQASGEGFGSQIRRRLTSLSQKLDSIDVGFRSNIRGPALESLASATWILPAQLPYLDEFSDRSQRPKSQVLSRPKPQVERLRLGHKKRSGLDTDSAENAQRVAQFSISVLLQLAASAYQPTGFNDPEDSRRYLYPKGENHATGEEDETASYRPFQDARLASRQSTLRPSHKGEHLPHIPRRDSAHREGAYPSDSPPSQSPRRRRTATNSSSAATDPKDPLEEVAAKIKKYKPSEGGLDNERQLWSDCLGLLQTPRPDPVAYYRISAQAFLVEFEQGDYPRAKKGLAEIRKKMKEAFPNEEPSRCSEISYHLAVVLTRLGEHREAFNHLQEFRGKPIFRKIEDWLKAPTPVPPKSFDDSLVETVVNSNRLVALLYGYYGRFHKAQRALESAKTQWSAYSRTLGGANAAWLLRESDVQSPIQMPIKPIITRAKISLADAKLYTLQGYGVPALEETRDTHHDLEMVLGKGHIATLEATSLKALILSRESDKEAETACTMAHDAVTRHLGIDHPLAMETLDTLTDVLLARSRPYEALDTAFALWTRAKKKKKLGKDHPQTLRYCYQVGKVNLSIGNYLQAKEYLSELYETANEKWKGDRAHELSQYPDVLRYRVKLAAATSALGLPDAHLTAWEALSDQARLFSASNVGKKDDDMGRILRRIGIKIENGQAGQHPDLLQSLATYATISKKLDPSRPLWNDILEFVYRKRLEMHSASHFVTLSSQLELAFALLDGDDGGNTQHIGEQFRCIQRECDRLFGPNHILTLRSRLGSLFTNGLGWAIPRFNSEASKIVMAQEVLLGQTHPIVMDSMRRLFKLQLAIDPEEAHATAMNLLQLARREDIRKERLLASLGLERQVAESYAVELADYEQGLPIINEMLRFCRSPEHDSLQGPLAKELQSAAEKTRDLLEKAVTVAADALGYADSLSRQQEEARRAMNTFLDLARRMEREVPEHRRPEGLEILGRLLEQANIPTEESRVGWLSTKMRERYERWRSDETGKARGHYRSRDHGN